MALRGTSLFTARGAKTACIALCRAASFEFLFRRTTRVYCWELRSHRPTFAPKGSEMATWMSVMPLSLLGLACRPSESSARVFAGGVKATNPNAQADTARVPVRRVEGAEGRASCCSQSVAARRRARKMSGGTDSSRWLLFATGAQMNGRVRVRIPARTHCTCCSGEQNGCLFVDLVS